MDALRDSPIKFITTRHEQGAAFMADAYGRLTGKAGVCLSILSRSGQYVRANHEVRRCPGKHRGRKSWASGSKCAGFRSARKFEQALRLKRFVTLQGDT
jgi:hypothetical protein